MWPHTTGGTSEEPVDQFCGRILLSFSVEVFRTLAAAFRTPAVCGFILLQFSEKTPHRLSKVLHFFELSCAGKL